MKVYQIIKMSSSATGRSRSMNSKAQGKGRLHQSIAMESSKISKHNQKARKKLWGSYYQFLVLKYLSDLNPMHGFINLPTDRLSFLEDAFKGFWLQTKGQKEDKMWVPHIKEETQFDYIGWFEMDKMQKLQLTQQNLVVEGFSEFSQYTALIVEAKKSLSDRETLLHQTFSQIAHLMFGENVLGKKPNGLIYVWVCDGNLLDYRNKMDSLKEMSCLKVLAKEWKINFLCKHFDMNALYQKNFIGIEQKLQEQKDIHQRQIKDLKNEQAKQKLQFQAQKLQFEAQIKNLTQRLEEFLKK